MNQVRMHDLSGSEKTKRQGYMACPHGGVARRSSTRFACPLEKHRRGWDLFSILQRVAECDLIRELECGAQGEAAGEGGVMERQEAREIWRNMIVASP